MSFDADAFVSSCYDALAEPDPVGATRELVARAVATHGSSIGDRITTLHASPQLTVQVIAWPAGSMTDPHEHAMWAVVGVFAGEERNNLYAPTEQARLEAAGSRLLGVGDVLTLPDDAVHDAASVGSVPLGALHVYGGDLFNVDRRAWDPAGIAGSYEQVVVGRRRMFEAIAEVERSCGATFDDDQRRDAMLALWGAASAAGRYLDADESADVIRRVATPS